MKGDFHVRFRENVGVKFPCVTRLAAKLSETTVQTKEIIVKLKIKKQKQVIRVKEFYSFGLTNLQIRTCNHFNLYNMDTS